jgi:threonylcarbamoyladenosine tRNA methylthiotransferase MtaB
MNRRYSTSQFAKILKKCHNAAADLAVGIDVMAGFPGETEEQFATTYSFLKDLDFTYLHVFPYSPRPGTPAADFKDQLNGTVKEQRVDKLRRLSDANKASFYRRFIGDVRPVLIENKLTSSGQLKGFTDNYIPVSFDGDVSLMNTVAKVKIESANGTDIQGNII